MGSSVSICNPHAAVHPHGHAPAHGNVLGEPDLSGVVMAEDVKGGFVRRESATSAELDEFTLPMSAAMKVGPREATVMTPTNGNRRNSFSLSSRAPAASREFTNHSWTVDDSDPWRRSLDSCTLDKELQEMTFNFASRYPRTASTPSTGRLSQRDVSVASSGMSHADPSIGFGCDSVASASCSYSYLTPPNMSFGECPIGTPVAFDLSPP